MTETELKLRDAEIQLQLAMANSGNDELVRSCVNSLISAGRSVTFVMQAESSHPALEQWYRARMSTLASSPDSGPLLQFFNEARVHSIHKGVVSPEQLTTRAVDFKINGVLTTARPTVTFYRFNEASRYFPGRSGGVFRMCEEYLSLLRTLTREWLAKRAECTTP